MTHWFHLKIQSQDLWTELMFYEQKRERAKKTLQAEHRQEVTHTYETKMKLLTSCIKWGPGDIQPISVWLKINITPNSFKASLKKPLIFLCGKCKFWTSRRHSFVRLLALLITSTLLSFSWKWYWSQCRNLITATAEVIKFSMEKQIWYKSTEYEKSARYWNPLLLYGSTLESAVYHIWGVVVHTNCIKSSADCGFFW